MLGVKICFLFKILLMFVKTMEQSVGIKIKRPKILVGQNEGSVLNGKIYLLTSF